VKNVASLSHQIGSTNSFALGAAKAVTSDVPQREKLNLLERLFAKHVPSNGSAPLKRDLFAA
jgi:hypothetical protein